MAILARYARPRNRGYAPEPVLCKFSWNSHFWIESARHVAVSRSRLEDCWRRVVAMLLFVVLLLAPNCLAQSLLRAIKDNNPAMVNIALKTGVKGGINAELEDGDNPLQLAVRLGKHKAVRSKSARVAAHVESLCR